MTDPIEPPARLVHLVSSLEVGGKERVVLDLARRARAEGLDHRLLLFDAPFRPGGRDFDPGEVPWEFIPRGPGLDLGFARRVRRFVRGFGADVLHAHNDTAIVYGALANLPQRAAALFGTFHTKPGHDTPRARRSTHWASGRCHAVVAVSDELADILTDLRWSRRPGVIWNGVDLARFGPAPSSEGRAGSLRVVSLARADPIKRTVDLIDAVVLLRERGLDVSLTAAGDGPLFDELAARAAAAPGGVEVLRRVADVAEFLRGADAFALVSDHEAAPRALLEAMATGLACCVTRVGGMPEMLLLGTDAPAALFVAPRSVLELAGALADLAEDTAKRRELGRRARERAAHYGADAEWQSYVGLWSLSQRRRGASRRGPS